MKLKQLIEVFDQQNLRDVPKNSKGNETGSGHFSSVASNKDDPHTVIKTATKHDTAYNAYVDFLMKNKIAQRNPHFPRIYVSAGGKHWEMEKLHMTLQEYLIYEAADTEEANERIRNVTELYLIDEFSNIPNSPALGLQTRVSSLVFALQKPKNIKLESWKEAVKIVHDFIDSDPEFREDIASKNIMVRLSPVGIQLVFTDPAFCIKDV